jgi:hypothetical protein
MRRWQGLAAVAAAGGALTLSLLPATAGAAASGGSTSAGRAAASGPAPAAPYTCAPGGDGTIFGTFGDAALIGWAGDKDGVVACLGGSFYVRDGKNATYGYGVYDDSRTQWQDADGYLPALVTSFSRDGADISITNFGDKVTVGGHAIVAIYSRVAVRNPTSRPVTISPQASAGLIPLDHAPDTVQPGATADHDYVVAADRFGGKFPFPSASALAAAGGFDAHFAGMKNFWNGQLAQIAQLKLPDAQLSDAYRAGFINTQIIRDGSKLTTGENGYDAEFSHDVIGILANLFTQGDFSHAHALLNRARTVIGAQSQYADGDWTYSWPWAIYLLKTGDLRFVKAHFGTEGPKGASEPSIKDTAHKIAAQRTGPGGIMEKTSDIDANGYWTIDNYEALMGLAAYHWLAQQVHDATEVKWAARQYDSLLAATNATLGRTIAANHLGYLPCSMVEPNTSNRCANAEDANWAAPFLFGRWAWDAQLFGARVSGPGIRLIDATYKYGFARLAGKLPADTFGGYPTDYWSTAYNAGYGSWGLASSDYRSQGIASYQWMIANDQSGPFSWWESSDFPNTGSPWTGVHPASGNGSAPHAWGIANANKVLLDSLAAQRSDGALIVGRGIPSRWLASGQPISVANFPTTDGHRISFTITGTGSSVTLTITSGRPAGDILFQLPAFVGDIASTSAGTVDQPSGTVTLGATVRRAVVQLREPATASAAGPSAAAPSAAAPGPAAAGRLRLAG